MGFFCEKKGKREKDFTRNFTKNSKIKRIFHTKERFFSNKKQRTVKKRKKKKQKAKQVPKIVGKPHLFVEHQKQDSEA